MRDPNPSNITGEKVQRHVFKHSINWGYVAIAVAAVVVALKLLSDASDDEGKNQGIASEMEV